MRSCGFAAREVMGWLRGKRPGSVIGEQQHYLCEVERDLRERRAAPPAPGRERADPPDDHPLPPRSPPAGPPTGGRMTGRPGGGQG